MSTETNIGGTYTLVDLAKMLAPGDGSFLFCAETLARKNPIVREVPIIEANQLLTHIGNRQGALPSVGFRAINKGVATTVHKESQITAPMALLEAMSQVDVELTRLGPGSPEQVRARIDAAHMEAMSQKLATTIFYGNVGDDALSFNGMATMFNSLTSRPNSDTTWPYNVIGEGGSGSDTTSAFIVEWGLGKAHLIYPKGTQAGIEIKFLGEQLVLDSGGTNKFVAYVTNMKWRCGLFIQDERCVQRLTNIESTGTTNIFSDDDLLTLCNRLPSMGEDPMTRIYVNRTLRTQMDIRVKDKMNMHYTNINDAFGKPTLYFRGIPVQVCDAIVNTETVVA
jgi:hypothetical protein